MSVVFQGCPKLLGHPQYDPRMNLGWEKLPRDGHSCSYPPCLSIPGFLRYSDGPGIIPPLSEYPRIPGILGRSWDHPGMDTALPPLSEYPGIPGILGRSQDHPGMDTALPLPLSEYLGIPGILERSQDHPRMDGHSSTPPV